MFETNEKVTSLSKTTGDKKKSQMEILDLKNLRTEKNLNGKTSTWGRSRGNNQWIRRQNRRNNPIWASEGKETGKRKKKKKKKNSLRNLWDYNKRAKIPVIRVLEGDEKEGGDEKILEDIMAENFLIWQEIDLQNQEAKSTSNRITPLP